MDGCNALTVLLWFVGGLLVGFVPAMLLAAVFAREEAARKQLTLEKDEV